MVLNPSTDALLIIDLQNDFCRAEHWPLRRRRDRPRRERAGAGLRSCVLTQDWHPPKHISFASAHPDSEPSRIAPWRRLTHPDALAGHCVQGIRRGVASGLSVPHAELILRKGSASTSIVFGISRERPLYGYGLAGYLRERGCGGCFCVGWLTTSASASLRSTALRSTRVPGYRRRERAVGCPGA